MKTQARLAMAALGMMEASGAQTPRRSRYTYRVIGTVTHTYTKRGKVTTKQVPLWRAEKIDRSRYTGEKLREIYRQNGSGKGLLLRAVRDAKRLMAAEVAKDSA